MEEIVDRKLCTGCTACMNNCPKGAISFKEGKVEKIKPNSILDLYCGVGSIGICISDYVDQVFGVEVVEVSLENKKVAVQFDEAQVTEASITETINSLGFDVQQ